MNDIKAYIDRWIEIYNPDHTELQYDRSETIRGALLAFGNLGVSIQWGAGTYSDNYDMSFESKTWESYTAEAAIWYKGCGLGYYLNPIHSPIRTTRLLVLEDGDTVTNRSEPHEIEQMIITCRDYARC